MNEEMDQMEDQLRRALRRQPAPENFRARVVAQTVKRPAWQTSRWWAAAATIVVTLGSAGGYYELQQRRGEAAKEKTMLALRITSEKLNHAKARIHKINIGTNQ